jgi:hypothetical protein|tara:strand:- start:48 stop:401 length:354 start_codon:yes stop_codon:yes gene_type:complete
MSKVIKIVLQNILHSINASDGSYDKSFLFNPLQEIGELCFKKVSETSKDLEKLNEYINYQRLRFIQDLFEEFKNFSKQTFFSMNKKEQIVLEMIYNDIIDVLEEELKDGKRLKNLRH